MKHLILGWNFEDDPPGCFEEIVTDHWHERPLVVEYNDICIIV